MTTTTRSLIGSSTLQNQVSSLPHPQIAFLPDAPNSDLYGIINRHLPAAEAECSGGIADGEGNSARTRNRGFSPLASNIISMTADDIVGGKKSSLSKHGPSLLEIRRLKYSLFVQNINRSRADNSCNEDNDQDRNDDSNKTNHEGIKYQSSHQKVGFSSQQYLADDRYTSRHHRANSNELMNTLSTSLVQHETVLVSRGIPGFGANIASTCLDFRPSMSHLGDTASSNDNGSDIVRCATGLTSGALCVHTLSNLYHCSYQDDPQYSTPTATVAHYAPRQQRPATSVAWRPLSGGLSGNLVAVGLVGSSNLGLFTTDHSGIEDVVAGKGTRLLSRQKVLGSGIAGVSSSLTSVHLSETTRLTAMTSGGGSGGDRDFGTLVWDIEAQSSVVSGAGTVVGGSGKKGGNLVNTGNACKVGVTVPIKTPAYRFAHNCGVESLAWVCSGEILGVGCQRQSVQLYDLRVSGTNAPPISFFAHTEMVSGIVPDVANSFIFATFGKNVGEPVKIWDARKTQSHVSEIIPFSGVRDGGVRISAAAWSISRPGVLSIAIGNSIRSYDTCSPGSRTLPVGVYYIDGLDEGSKNSGVDCDFIQSFVYQPQYFQRDSDSAEVSSKVCTVGKKPFELYPFRAMAMTMTGEIHVVSESQSAPVAVSKRDGRVANSLGGTVWVGSTSDGPSAMEGISIASEDISSRMMRRARCSNVFRYSTDAMGNVRLLEHDKNKILMEECLHSDETLLSESILQSLSNTEKLLCCWRWIALVESLNFGHKGSENNETGQPNNTLLPTSSLINVGIRTLMRMNTRDGQDESSDWIDTKTTSDTLFCDVFDSPLRRTALIACGWYKKNGSLSDLIDACQSNSEYERSAALATWHGDLSACMAILQHAANDPVSRTKREADGNGDISTSYSELLSLIAMCVAGFNVAPNSNGFVKSTQLWSRASDNLLKRLNDTSLTKNLPRLQLHGVYYLRSILIFLQDTVTDSGFKRTIYDDGICLADRVGFACRFLPWADLRIFFDTTIRRCIMHGDLECLLITGLDKDGITLIQSYTDQSSDVQTAALISCRAALPVEWAFERKLCSEWLETYRLLLNGLQMWNSRAAFDVGRFEHLRRLKQGNSIVHSSSSRQVSIAKPSHKDEKLYLSNNFPAQLWARCNYCNTPLPLSRLLRQEGIANSWLSRQKPVLTCCPQCKKPLPRCSICLLSLGCLNPYIELQRERNQHPRSSTPMIGVGSGGNFQTMEDLSGLASAPFATWFSWCMRCKHGGHAHHLCAWFERHETCAVSGCDCRCQFDGIKKITRSGLVS